MTTQAAAEQVASKLITELRQHPLQLEDTEITLTTSIGIATAQPDNPPLSSETMLQYADQALYSAKSAGRNCIIMDDAPCRLDQLPVS